METASQYKFEDVLRDLGIEELLRDLRYGARMLAENRGITLVAVFTLALGIGANTAIFTVVNSVLIRPLPFEQPERLMQARYLTQPGVPQGDYLSWINRYDQDYWRRPTRNPRWMSSSLLYARVRCTTSPVRSQSTGDRVSSDQL